MEAVGPVYLDKVQMTPNIDTGELTLRAFLNGNDQQEELSLKVDISFEGEPVTSDTYGLREKEEVRTVLLQHCESFRRCRLWSPEHPNLYDITFILLQNDEVIDVVTSYFGIRKISVENGRLMLNNHFYFMRLVLDQGYFPDGNLTPPSDEAIKRDIELTKAMGFNGARKHQKLEDPRWLYWSSSLYSHPNIFKASAIPS